MNFNPMQLFGMIKNGGNPQQIIQQIMENNQMMQNPMAKNAMELYQKGDAQGIEQMARNLCKEKGINPDDMMNQIKGQFKIN